MKSKICKWYPVCPMKRFYEKGLLDKRWIEEYCMKSNPNCLRRKMEEEGKYHPDNMLPDGTRDENLK